MSRNQQSIWHNTHQQQDIVAATPARLELVPERACDLELCTAETLRRTQEELLLYRRLYENIPSVYFSLDITGIILFVNQFGANCLGYTPEDLINQPIFNLFASSDRQRLSDALMRLLKASPKSEVVSWEFRLNCPASKILWVKIVARLLPDGNGQYLSDPNLADKSSRKNPVILLVFEDITAHRQAEDAFRESEQRFHKAVQAQLEEMESLNRLKDEFLSTVSHELRTPLTNMKMAIQMLGIALDREQNFLSEMAKPQAQRSKAARYFEILDNECDREINLISNFLDLQRLDTGAKPLVLETLEVQQWLWRVVELFKARNRNSCQQNLHLNVAPNLPPLMCDPFSLERILIELLTNACKFSPPNAEITVCAQRKSRTIQFQVINSGVEIPTSELPHIFDKFYRIPSNDPWKQGGTGLGLALVQKLTKHLGGTIEVESGSNRTSFAIQLALSSEA
ncbi:MAG: PAS domain-containing sensor histidine kinase [Mojavia pulchra JT2-VF2]|jgi:PAS domain S-box-containing protein|uniref:histidine kinase n=1 Tax=Mojavia pulchra JT2-VF2 TaxID=287848 RepID=A0A951PVU0_9NOST|nr:PAS domain-containing sensor histidine kinase [Mojavia pulchra JT2-VF2]